MNEKYNGNNSAGQLELTAVLTANMYVVTVTTGVVRYDYDD